ncbi:hypothetical protein DAPPUDRAFT_326305 [Daphnia pulex]|uniref:Uncharacterized protein n=1 Tax=Daphnia pulex TaxID=6669 RepID=E9H7C2_DAPPU|nr:hypothetical protein DAPPUDRAFT_326305 [Daphnia pulex]|eukprot:EFX72351.1 hypothetical protein DAPPUDRAFT_326305 [Daphnia pulex]
MDIKELGDSCSPNRMFGRVVLSCLLPGSERQIKEGEIILRRRQHQGLVEFTTNQGIQRN